MVARHEQTSFSSSWMPLKTSLKMRYSFFIAMRTVTARSPMIAIQNAQEDDAQVVGWYHDQDDSCIFCFLNSSALFSLAFHFSIVFERFLTNGHEDGKVPGQICWSQPKITVLEFQYSHGPVNVIVLRCHRGICGVFLVSVSSLGCRPLLSFDSSLARNIIRSFSPWVVCSLAQFR